MNKRKKSGTSRPGKGTVSDEAIAKSSKKDGGFKPHMMYDPKTGKGYKANKVEDHERMKKKGYDHRERNPDNYDKGGAWTRKEGQNPTGGLNAKGRASLKAKGQNIQAPVTESNPTGKRNARKKSFCARMRGMRKRQKKSNNTGKDRLSLSLKKWNCKNGGPCGPNTYETGGFLEPAIPNIFE